jgi:hypothetical protein
MVTEIWAIKDVSFLLQKRLSHYHGTGKRDRQILLLPIPQLTAYSKRS